MQDNNALPPNQTPASDPARAIRLALAAMCVLSIQDAIIKWLAADYPLLQLMFVRSALVLIPLALLTRHLAGVFALPTRRPARYLLHVGLQFASFMSFYYSLTRLPLADALAFAMTAPLFIAALSGPLLGERADGPRTLALGVGFSGVIIMIGPQWHSTDWLGVAAALAGSALYALWLIHARFLSVTERSEQLVFYGALGMALVTAATLPWIWTPVASASDGGLMGLLGLTSALGLYGLMQAYRYAPVYVVAPYDFTALIWAALLGFLVWKETPAPSVILGAGMVVATGLYVYRHSAR